jgi:WhiB family redox-sensing transcriptional regulator
MNNEKLPKPLIEYYEWQERGKCRGEDPELFFLPSNVRMSNKDRLIAKAKAVCVECPVISECLQFALDAEEQYGVWGGLSVEERNIILRRKKATI